MAELTWKGKNTANISQILSPQAQLHTIATFPSQTHSWYNRLIYGDKSEVLPALLAEFAGAIDLIYIDPPFMTGRNFMLDKQLAYSDKWKNDVDIYLGWLYETLVLLHRLLAMDGSLYVHLDWRAVHYARVLLDEIFGYSVNAEGPGFKSEIIWHYQSGGRSQRLYARKHDTLLLYTKSGEYCFHGERIGERRGTERRNHMRKEVGVDGRVSWTIHAGGRVYSYDEDSLMTAMDVWSDISHLHQKDPERNGYATQKPAALLERVLLASSEEHDLVLDCFCGSGVTPAVAEQLRRRWLACDASPLAIELTQQRLLARADCRPFVVQHVYR